MPTCSHCGVATPNAGVACPQCGTPFPNLGADNAAEFFIPYKNGLALAAYYVGLGSILCGAFLGVPAIVLGILGISRANRFPAARGKAHAWTGIILGALTTIASIVLVLMMFAAARR